MKKIITGMDLGSSNIRACVSRMDGAGNLKLLALDNIVSGGIENGSIVDFDIARDGIKNIMQRLEDKAKVRIKSVSLGLTGSGIEGFTASGMIGLSQKPREIYERDIEKCKKIAGLIQIPSDRQAIQKTVQSFYINEGEKVRNPLGLYATKLGVNIYAVTCEISKIKNLHKCVDRAGYILNDIVFFGDAVKESVLTGDDTKGKAAIIDIGSHATHVVLYEESRIQYMKYIPKGMRDFEGKDFTVSFLQNVKKAINGHGISKAILTGGAVLKEDILEKTEKTLGIKCESGRVRLGWCHLSPKDSILHTTSLGLAVYEAKKIRHLSYAKNPARRIQKYLIRFLDSYF